MADFEVWERETLNRFAREAAAKLVENEAEIARLRNEQDKLAQELLTADVFVRLVEWLREPQRKRAANAFTAGIARQIAYALEMDVLPEVARMHKGHERYETARRMNPQQWADAWKLNCSTGKPFDEIIDDLRPFMGFNAEVTGVPGFSGTSG